MAHSGQRHPMGTVFPILRLFPHLFLPPAYPSTTSRAENGSSICESLFPSLIPAKSVIKHPEGAMAFICLLGKEPLGLIKN